MNAVYIVPLTLPTTHIIPNKLHGSSKAAQSLPWSICCHAEGGNTQYLLCMSHVVCINQKYEIKKKRPTNAFGCMNVIYGIHALKCTLWYFEKFCTRCIVRNIFRIMYKGCLFSDHFSFQTS
jgi:hypothetical protein